jgi:transcriptional regulator GlxA family with amidase domain
MPKLIDARTVAIVAFDGVEALDLIGPLETFVKARRGDEDAYNVQIVALAPGEVRAESGLTFRVHQTLASAEHCDTLIIPGGQGLRDGAIGAPLCAWLASRSHNIRRIASVCTGAFALAEAGLLNGRRATTHWRFIDQFAARFPDVTVDPGALYVRDDRFYSSAGVLAGVDLALALIEEDLGPGAATDIAREVVTYMRRPGDAPQVSAALRARAESGDRLADLGAWIATHLTEDLRVETLAARIGLSPRQFSRRFQALYGEPPATYVETLRLEAANALMSAGGSLDRVANAVGLANAAALRRLFRRRMQISPSQARRRRGWQEASSIRGPS